MDFESILEEIVLGRGQENLKLKVVLRPKKQFLFFFGFQNYVN